eukprot:gb/GFBE01047733.1/.p1 GENE.gb/GFBE01047733.1/~~gb/GFBE01047733.1/.p1  ORF type:complete len:197 (+),score=14.74 gb/GFBE01047733.1/:1-591(+)
MNAVCGDCSVCLEPITAHQQRTMMDGSCRHSFHWHCLQQVIRANPSCPNCRAEISSFWLALPDGSATRYTVRDVQVDFNRASGFNTLIMVQANLRTKRGTRVAFMLPSGGQLNVPAPRDLQPGDNFYVQMPLELQSPLDPWPKGEWYPCSHCATALYLSGGLRSFTCTQCGQQSSHSRWSLQNIGTTLKELIDDFT